jgi:S-DNA-T family DNA segregation ATPase FtsK/SpoIIIE
MDFGAEVLKAFQSMPQVGEYLTSYDGDKVENLLKMLEREYQKRKEILSEYGGSFTSYIKKNPNKLSMIIVVINNYEGFMENFENLEDSFNRLFREASKSGIIFITTATAHNSLSFRISQNFSTIFAMRLNDIYDYRYLMDIQNNLVPKKVFGRGITKVNDRPLEYQTAYINVFENINQTIKTTAVNMINTYKVKVKSVPTIPSKVNASTMNKFIKDLKSVPIGVDVVDINIATFDFFTPRISVVTSNDIKMCYEFLPEFYNILSKIPNTTFALYDSFLSINIPSSIPVVIDATEFAKVICSVVTKSDQPPEHRLVIIAGLRELLDNIGDEKVKERFINILENINYYPNTSIIILESYNELRNLSTEKWYQNNISDKNCIWIGTGFENQVLFTLTKEIEGESIPEYTNYMGYLLINGVPVLVKVVASE